MLKVVERNSNTGRDKLIREVDTVTMALNVRLMHESKLICGGWTRTGDHTLVNMRSRVHITIEIIEE